ncbi:PD-(D/E)XK motif protein [Streptomyces sp. NPDC060048]|uniref:PD-(D/E)XK motif protein n=1 Tax=unclassified Streptomyces TaxID=2593676 RepID=UPI0036B00DA4
MTDRSTAPELGWSTVEHYLGAGQATSYRLSDTGARRLVRYEIGHSGRDISLTVELDRHQRPPRSVLPAVTIDQISQHGTRMARITTTQVSLMRDFHDLLMAVAGRIVSGKRTLEQALDETIHAWGELLDRPRGLGLEKRIGLHGELAVLRTVARAHGWEAAARSWTGPRGEQHDFGLAATDIEVKTTTSEERRHTVHGVRQLEETEGRPLWFASLQLTRGGIGGRSLGESAAAVLRDACAAGRIAAMSIESALGSAGWSPSEQDDERWTLRTEPLFVPADRLPRMTTDMLPAAVREHVSSINYCIHVDHLPPAPGAPVDLTDFRLP